MFCGLVQLDSRHGAVEWLPALAATCHVIMTKNKETTVLLSNSPMPYVGSDNITDCYCHTITLGRQCGRIDEREVRGLRARVRRQEASIFMLDKIQGSLQSREQETELEPLKGHQVFTYSTGHGTFEKLQ
jgi:hypothetical protein